MNSDWLVTPMVLAIAATIWFVADKSLGTVFQSRVSSEGIRVRLFGKIPVAHIPLDQIQGIARESWLDLPMDGSLKDSSRAGVSWFRKPVVVRRHDRGPVLLSPQDPEGFIAEVNRCLELGRLTRA